MIAVDAAPVLELDEVERTFVGRDGSEVKAVRPSRLHIAPGEIVALVGESGSGKSTLAKIALALELPDKGSVRLEGRDLLRLSKRELRRRRIAMQPVFQDPTAAFNPRRSIRQVLYEAIACRSGHTADPERLALEILHRVGLTPAANFIDRYPHEISGGQRQRLGIARALAAKPKIIIADEPLSGADVSIRGQILNLLLDLRREEGLSILFITHDISIAEVFADRVVVMYRGMIVEEGPASEVLKNPAHPYTRLLWAAVPHIDGDDIEAVRRLIIARPEGSGCPFYSRCVSAIERCAQEMPGSHSLGQTRQYRCFVQPQNQIAG
ncbi:ABC transporter ATP-binding protein [uncultured Ferrovibrio sp.]|jgi:oligopeptide/dipeptide ABC transporter ATP-binding protein|uniref:ABC transporter ATP-binding protein n=1 Tax=uncultured Ferrovibrio sp. TaxID=1576913 RepID=UPI00262B6617|nr:ABC transporter ATP-binding protein [uncultured Ferrovibrio sp.]